MKYLLFVSVLLLSATACHQRTSSDQSPEPEKDADTLKKAFFPVADYLLNEISYVDSTPLAIVQYVTEGKKKTDSAFINPVLFHRLAGEFLLPELDPVIFNKEYKESSFVDETSKSLSFTYSTNNKALALRRVDVLASPENTGRNKLKSIYLENREERKDSLIIKKMFWQIKRQFEIVTITSVAGHEVLVRQVKVVWDPGDPVE